VGEIASSLRPFCFGESLPTKEAVWPCDPSFILFALYSFPRCSACLMSPLRVLGTL